MNKTKADLAYMLLDALDHEAAAERRGWDRAIEAAARKAGMKIKYVSPQWMAFDLACDIEDAIRALEPPK
jgi:hypothetical protein